MRWPCPYQDFIPPLTFHLKFEGIIDQWRQKVKIVVVGAAGIAGLAFAIAVVALAM